jgi:hypothetical protein
MNRQPGTDLSHLRYLENQREELRKAILQAPRHRLDNLASFVETHGERLSHLLEALMNYRLLARKANLKHILSGVALNLALSAGAVLGLMTTPVLAGMDPLMLGGIGGGIFVALFSIWMTFVKKYTDAWFHRKTLKNINDLTPLQNQTRKDTWESVKAIVLNHLQKTGGKYSLNEVRKEHADVRMVFEKGTHDIREALNELATVRDEKDVNREP